MGVPTDSSEYYTKMFSRRLSPFQIFCAQAIYPVVYRPQPGEMVMEERVSLVQLVE